MVQDDATHAIVRRLFEDGLSSTDPGAVGEIIHQHYLSNDGPFHAPPSPSGEPGFLHGAEAFAAHVMGYRAAYDDLRFAIVRMLTEDDTVLTVWNASGTTKNLRFVNRGGQEQPYELHAEGVSLTKVVGGKVRQHDMFWPRSPLFPGSWFPPRVASDPDPAAGPSISE